MNKIKKETILQAQMGVSEALDMIIDLYSKLAYYHALRYLKYPEDAKDCAQDAISKIILSLHDYNPKKSDFNTWAFTITRNCILNHLRHNNIVKNRIVLDEEEVDQYCIYENTEDSLLLSEVEQAIGSYKYRILISKIGYSKSFVEIGRMLNLPHYTVRRLYNEALYEAKKFLEERNNGQEIKAINIRRFQ